MWKIVAGLFTVALVLAACGPADDVAAPEPDPDPVEAPDEDPADADPDEPADDPDDPAPADGIQMPDDHEDGLIGLGPNGMDPTPVEDIEISDEDCDEISAGDHTAAIVMHYMASDWSRLQVQGITESLEACGVEIVATTDAGFDTATQINDIETIIQAAPDVIFSIPTDEAATATAYRQIVDAGIHLVLLDNIPQELEWPDDYASVVAGDSRWLGREAARLLLEAVGTDAQVGMIEHGAVFFVTEEREIGAREVFDLNDVEVITSGEILDPDEGLEVGEGILTAHADVAGLWVVWDTPAMGAITAARTLDRSDLWVTSVDLGLEIAREIASGQLAYGVAAYSPHDSGYAEAQVAFNALLGRETPGYIGTPGFAVTRENLLESWRTVHKEEPPQELVDLCAGECGE